jgi:hypothetical protein
MLSVAEATDERVSTGTNAQKAKIQNFLFVITCLLLSSLVTFSVYTTLPSLVLNVHALAGAVWGSSSGNEPEEPPPLLQAHFEQI